MCVLGHIHLMAYLYQLMGYCHLQNRVVYQKVSLFHDSSCKVAKVLLYLLYMVYMLNSNDFVVDNFCQWLMKKCLFQDMATVTVPVNHTPTSQFQAKMVHLNGCLEWEKHASAMLKTWISQSSSMPDKGSDWKFPCPSLTATYWRRMQFGINKEYSIPCKNTAVWQNETNLLLFQLALFNLFSLWCKLIAKLWELMCCYFIPIKFTVKLMKRKNQTTYNLNGVALSPYCCDVLCDSTTFFIIFFSILWQTVQLLSPSYTA